MSRINRSSPRGFVRVQSAYGAKGFDGRKGSFKVTIPAALARMIGPDRLFRVELVDEGILLRYVEGGEPVALPSWLT